MVREIRRRAVVLAGVAAIGVLGVACSGATQVSSTTSGFHASFGGAAFNLPSPMMPMLAPLVKPAAIDMTTTTTTKKDDLVGAVHSGEGCPIALPQ